MKKNLYFVQVGFEFDGSVYLPYAAGTIIAYCRKNQAISDAYDFADIIFKREPIESAIAQLKSPYLVGFSCSVWNMEYNKALAKKIKEKYPECIIVFGGHSVSENGELLKEESYIDYLMFGEGEIAFCELLKNLPDNTVESTPNIAFRKGEEIILTEKSFCKDLSTLPSPYITGVFDKIIKENPGADFLSVLETTRGCPYSCAYCDWCAGKKMRFFPLKKVFAEIDWLSENKVEYCFCADSNFGMFDRDIEIADYLIKTKKANGYPKVFRPCYEKNSDERVFRICSALNSVGMDKGATMAYQTLSPEALENIGRKNLTMEHFSSLMKKYNEAGIPTYSELILGLPGETKESFCKGICTLFENGQHNSLSVYHCEVLPNSDLAMPEFIKKHGIETIKVAFNHIHSAPKKNEEVKEYSYLVRSTATMSREDWVYSNLFSVCIQTFHSLGILRFLAVYLYNEGYVSYFDFYTGLLDYILNSEGKLNALWKSFKNKYESSLAGDWNYYNEDFGNVTWFFEEGAFLEFVRDYDSYFAELTAYIERFAVPSEILSELLSYQKAIIRKPFEEGGSYSFSHDFHSYFKSIITSEEARLEKVSLTLEIAPQVVYDVPTYAKEAVWFGRRRGATVYRNDEVKSESKK